jgi:hypothetical protein
MRYTISTPLVHLGKKETPVSCYLTRVCKKHSVPRAAFEIIKVGKMWVKRKMQKNTAI